MEGEDDLDILTALLVENEEEMEESGRAEGLDGADDLDDLFDNDDEEDYDEGLDEEAGGTALHDTSALFGDVEDLEEEDEEDEERSSGPSCSLSGKTKDRLDKSKEDLEAELKHMQEQMQLLQERLEATQTPAPPRAPPPPPKRSTQPDNHAAPAGGRAPPAVSAPLLKNTKRTAHQHKPSADEDLESSPVGPRVCDSFSPPQRTNSKLNSKLKSPPPTALPQQASPPVQQAPPKAQQAPPKAQQAPPKAQQAPPKAQQAPPKAQQAPPTLDVAVEKFSGLRVRKPRVSSVEMAHKMADRRLIRLSQLPDRMARERLEDSDWVTFAVVVSKVTPQSTSSGKTFSIWKLNDLHDLEVYVSLFLFGEVHKEHWKTQPGTVIGILNPNPMKAREGSDGACLSVDHVQKILLMGEAQDFGTCKASKKNGQPCSQLVNLYECQYCQYHVKAQYKKLSARRAELQSCFSGKVPGKAQGGRGRGGASLKERLCHTGFHYGGVSSAACATSLTASQPKRTQTTLSSLVLRGAGPTTSQDKSVALQADQVTGCSDDFRSLLTLPTPGALQLKRHLTQATPSGSAGGGLQSISASQLLKQQKQQMLQSRKRRAEEIQQRFMQSAGSGGTGAEGPGLGSLKGAAPTLGRGLAQGEDILFFDHTPPPPPASHSLSTAKLAALKKLRQKGGAISREDPNAVKRKRANMSDIASKVENNLQASPGEEGAGPALKRRREHLDYLQSDEFQSILSAKSRHMGTLQAAEFQIQEQYFEPLVKKEQMEEKMRNIREMKCRAVTCKTCKYTYFKPLDQCVECKHDYHWHDAIKRFFRCPCGQRSIALDRLPHKPCSNCGLFKWARDSMLKEKPGPKIAGELLLPRGEEQPKFINSIK